MEIKVLEKSSNELKFLIKGIDATAANTLRRAMLNEVPILAIKSATFVKNGSVLFDEMIAQRLGLIPLKADLSNFEFENECSCKGKGCPKCQVIFTLNCEGPLTVYADALKCSDSTIKPVHSKIPLVKLLKNQELELEAVATLGTGNSHAKYVSCLAYYQGEPKITINNVKNAEEIMKNCPVDLFELEGKGLKVKDHTKCTLCGACEDIAEPKGGITVEASDKDFIFTVESWEQLSSQQIFERAIEILDKKLDEFEGLLGKIK